MVRTGLTLLLTTALIACSSGSSTASRSSGTTSPFTTFGNIGGSGGNGNGNAAGGTGAGSNGGKSGSGANGATGSTGLAGTSDPCHSQGLWSFSIAASPAACGACGIIPASALSVFVPPASAQSGGPVEVTVGSACEVEQLDLSSCTISWPNTCMSTQNTVTFGQDGATYSALYECSQGAGDCVSCTPASSSVASPSATTDGGSCDDEPVACYCDGAEDDCHGGSAESCYGNAGLPPGTNCSQFCANILDYSDNPSVDDPGCANGPTDGCCWEDFFGEFYDGGTACECVPASAVCTGETCSEMAMRMVGVSSFGPTMAIQVSSCPVGGGASLGSTGQGSTASPSSSGRTTGGVGGTQAGSSGSGGEAPTAARRAPPARALPEGRRDPPLGSTRVGPHPGTTSWRIGSWIIRREASWWRTHRDGETGIVSGGCTLGQPGEIEPCATLDGATGFIATPLNPTGSAAITDYTLMAWINPAQLPSSAGHEMRLLSNGGYGNVNGAIDWLVDTANGVAIINQSSGGQDIYRSTPGVITAGVWTHLAVVYSSATHQPTVFVNGQSVSGTYDSGSTCACPTPTPPTSSTLELLATIWNTSMARSKTWPSSVWLSRQRILRLFTAPS